MSDALIKWAADVPVEDERNPACWVEYLKRHSPTQRRIARAVVELYDGNAAKVAKLIGVNAATVQKHVRHSVIRYMIGEIRPALAPEFAIMDRVEREEFLSEVVRSEHAETKDRLKALELLGKMNGDYVERVEVKGQITTLHELVRSLVDEPPPRAGIDFVPHTAPVTRKDDDLGGLIS